jgi:O-succinylbenzoic acid--CoA ligase
LTPPEVDRILAAAGTAPREGTKLVLATAGSTAEPKLVELSLSALEAAARLSNARLHATATDPWLCCLPLSHIAGIGIVVRTVMAGSELIVHERFDAAEVARSEAAFISLVPTMLVRLLDAKADLSGFKAVLLGGAHVSASLLKRAGDAGATVITTYGMTETCGGVVYDGSPLDGVKVDVNPDGAIKLGGPTLMSGYLGREDLTSEVLQDGWFLTSDLGRLSRGRLEIRGRLDDVIITGGENVQPAEVEAALEEHEDVAQALVTGTADDEWGERVVAFVVSRAKIGPEDLEEFLRSRLAPHKIPKDFHFVADLPLLPSGKVNRSREVLEEWLSERA